MRRRAGTNLAAAFLAVVAIAPPAAHASHARITHLSPGGGINNDGRAIFFEAASRDASKVFFNTVDGLVPEDGDGRIDLYEHSSARVRLISTSPHEPAGSTAAWHFGGISDQGEHVFFGTSATLVPEDTDSEMDVYGRQGDTVRLVSTGPASTGGEHFAWFTGTSADGGRALFCTPEQLVTEDDDSELDLYAREGGTTELVSLPPGAGNSARSACSRGASKDARVVVYDVADPPPNFRSDLYVASPDGTVALPGGPWTDDDDMQGASFDGISEDGTHVFYETPAALSPQDSDTWDDLYDYSNGSVELVSQGPTAGNSGLRAVFKAASADGSHVFFWTGEKLVPEDTDSAADVYERSGGETRLVSIGPAGGNGSQWATFSHITPDGETAFFHTDERLTLDDQDSGYQDVYSRSGGITTLVSNAKPSASARAELYWVSADGRRMILSGNIGGYEERTDGVSHPLGDISRPRAVSPDAGRVVFATDTRLLPSDQDSVQDLYEVGPGDPTRYARPQAATPLRVPLVPAYKQCTAPNTTHASGSLATNGCNPPAPESRTLTVGTADFNGKPTRSHGELGLNVRVGDPATPEDEADVDIHFRLTDVRRSADLSDYTGQLEVKVVLRLTDRSHGPEQSFPGTSEDIDFLFRVPCTATDADVGATCALDSSLRGLRCCVPRLEGKRTVMRVHDVRVYDSGPDANISTSSDNDVFAWPGVFIP